MPGLEMVPWQRRALLLKVVCQSASSFLSACVSCNKVKSSHFYLGAPRKLALILSEPRVKISTVRG